MLKGVLSFYFVILNVVKDLYTFILCLQIFRFAQNDKKPFKQVICNISKSKREHFYRM